MSDTIDIRDHGPWVEITLNRPDKLNALTQEMCAALQDALNLAAQKPARAVLITGAGRGFCTGQDLGHKNPNDGAVDDLGATLRETYNPIIRLITDMDCPVICAVNGVAAGAGAGIALACDIVLAADTAKFILPFAKIGLVPGAGSSWTLTRAIGLPRARALALTAEPVPAPQAADWGMIWKSVPAAKLMTQARETAALLAAGPTFGLARTKHLMAQAVDSSLAVQLEREAAEQTVCGRTADYAEGVAAFLAKRPPRFSGTPPE